jgi:hypothetical protein
LRSSDTYAGPTEVCDAFPDGIPIAIWHNRVDHRQPAEGDGGIRFEPKDQLAIRYAAQCFRR